MHAQLTHTETMIARFAGVLYLIIIIFGITSEVALRGPLVNFADAGGTAEAILGAINAFRLSIAADLVMAIADAGLAILLFVLLRSAAPVLALSAMVFRLIQSVMIGMNLMNMQGALLLVTAGQDLSGLAPGQSDAIALFLLNMHAHGYDLGLVFFGINSLMTGVLIWRSGLVHRSLGIGLGLAGMIYLTGSALRFMAPEAYDVFAPAYGITVLAETAFCLALLLKGVMPRRQVQPA
ncbi:DUF4386 domain-containing protein [Cucumibacter marinus]|uniref:DUF4386 domain-containing protein n=1 Tax=Cucumibacter marinus TaxID=1121252 RepID=UPI000421C948|nr:DUF4386 domain-containing protein [Cucumibacter marinus]